MSPLRFDDYLPHMRSDELKATARLWGASSQCRKDECLAIIVRGLNDPDRARGAVASLKTFERNALALAKQMGGAIEPGALVIALRAAGVPLPSPRYRGSEETNTIVTSLIRRGLFLSNYAHNPGYLPTSFGYEPSVIFSDERLLSHVGLPEVTPIDLQPTTPPSSTIFRRAQSVTLDIIGILQAIHDLGGLPLTQSGTVRVAEARKLVRAMSRQEQDVGTDGLTIPDPTSAFASALQHSGLLAMQAGKLMLQEPIERWASRPYSEQVNALLRGFILAREWQEGETNTWYDYQSQYRVQGRWALSIALAALPLQADAFFAVDDLERALFDRIGEYFSLYSPPQPPFYFRETPEQIRSAETQRHAKLRAEWLKREKPWIAGSLSSWLYYLELVELGMEKRVPVSVRLTDLGRAVLRPELATAPRATTPSSEGAWIVQPNFDIIVYLERVTPPQLAFLERHAERVQAQQHTAHYRLTRESVYRGFEAGTALHTLLTDLQAGAGAPLPSNVVTEIREWSMLREKITLRRRARLLEFPDEAACQRALDRGLDGASIGERFVLVNGAFDSREVAQTVDYAQPLERCLVASEKGELFLLRTARDLLIEPQLARWAERTPDGKWQLTAASVRAAIQQGARIDDLFALLQERLTHPIPPLLAVALRCWAGETLPVQLATVTVLRCSDPDVFTAIRHSQEFQPYVRGELGSDVLLVNTEQLPELRNRLAWMGLSISEELVIKARRPSASNENRA